jgi:NAD(P)H-hydrate epimerase
MVNGRIRQRSFHLPFTICHVMTRLTRAQVREVDRRSIEEYHIPGIVLMENAARAVGDEACRMLGNNCVGEILILCGGGNNGGDGLAAARHLHNRGARVNIGFTVDPANYKGDALTNWQIIQAMKIPAGPFAPTQLKNPRPMLLIDAIFGTGLSQPPRPPFAELAEAVNRSGLPVLAIDLPSGLDCDTGLPLGACIVAKTTVTFVAEKVGFDRAEAKPFLGEILVADIGCPIELIEKIFNEQP